MKNKYLFYYIFLICDNHYIQLTMINNKVYIHMSVYMQTPRSSKVLTNYFLLYLMKSYVSKYFSKLQYIYLIIRKLYQLSLSFSTILNLLSIYQLNILKMISGRYLRGFNFVIKFQNQEHPLTDKVKG